MPKPTVALIGAGRVGSTLALAAHRAGYPLQAIYTRTPDRAQPLVQATGAALVPTLDAAIARAELVFVATPDDVIAEIDRAGASAWRPGQTVVHFSGALPADILQHARQAGARAAAFHPLQSISDLESGLRNLPGIAYGVSGDPDALPLLTALAHDLGGYVLPLPDEHKTLYHAAAVFVSNFPVILFAQAVHILAGLGIPPEDAARALTPLIRGAAANLAAPGLPDALTGPLSRGDTGVIAAHLRHLNAAHPPLAQLYRMLSLAGLDLVRQQRRLDEAALDAMYDLLATQESEP